MEIIPSCQYSIRRARVDEAQFLSNLAIRSKSHWGYSEAFLDACRPYIKIDEDYINSWPVVVLEKGLEILGFYSLKEISSENRLDNLWIEPSYIGQGYGRVLFNDAVVKAKELGWNYFRLAGEPNTIDFYQKMGASLIGEVQSRLREDLFLPHMEKKL